LKPQGAFYVVVLEVNIDSTPGSAGTPRTWRTFCAPASVAIVDFKK
jgi:hypothetical protein